MVLLFFSVFIFAIGAQKYLGCYEDGSDRELKDDLFLNDILMTPQWCEERCGTYQYKYFGIQYGMECYCGNTVGKYPKKSDSDCYKKCPGDEFKNCGGDYRNSLYEVSKAFPRPPPRQRPALLALVMMVKDEAHTLPTTLRSLKNYIDYYYILDTGSTDGTQDAIRKVLGTNGEIWEEPFVDYGTTRNRVLEIAATAPNPPIFALMLSADETVYNPDALRAFCEQHRNLDGPNEEGYSVTMDTGQRFASVRLQRVSKGWRYHGKVHEYMASMDGKWHDTPRVPDAYIKFQATDSWRRLEGQKRILRILEEEKKERPEDPRVSFYLASSYSIVGNYSASLAEYRRRVALGGWTEEVYDSMYQIGWQLDNLKEPWEKIQQAWLDAHQYSPDRAEPLYWIAFHYHNNNQAALAFMFAERCDQVPFPKNVQLWVTGDVYEYKCAQLVGLHGYELGEYEAGTKGMAKTYLAFPKDVETYKLLLKYKKIVSNQFWQTIYPPQKPLLPPPDSNLPIEPTILLHYQPMIQQEVNSEQQQQPPPPQQQQINENLNPSVGSTDPLQPQQQPQQINNPTQDEDELHTGPSPLAWITIFINIIIVSVFICGFIKIAIRTKKTR